MPVSLQGRSMYTRFIALFLISLLSLSGTAAAHRCGTAFAAQNLRQQRASGLVAKQVTLSRGENDCDPRDYYDSVYTRQTSHFQIFYTLDKGPHATTPEFIDSLAKSLESAYTFHTKTMGMRAPQGIDTTSHYQMPVKKGFYPVEVADIDFLSDPYYVLKSQMCNGCYGITYPDSVDSRKSAIIIDNDFQYVPLYSTEMDTLISNGKTCLHPSAYASLYSSAYGFSYVDEWAKAIRVTAFHELFHAVQLQYVNLFRHWSYWIEASATANEEIGAPDINDYTSYIPDFLYSMNTPLSVIGYDSSKKGDYAMSILYLYLYGNVDKHFDKEIWESFEKKPTLTIEDHIKKMLDKRSLSADSVFHDFVTRLALSGENTKAVDKKLWLWEDQPLWSTARTINTERYSYYNSSNDGRDEKFEPDTILYSFAYYSGGSPVIDNYKGRATALVFKDGKADIRPLANTSSLDSINTDSFYADSIIWIFSRFDSPKIIPEFVRDSTLRAYPMPWRGSGQLCFTPLPEKKKFIEIRNGRGELVMREPYSKTTHCIEESLIKEKMTPGVYRFRAGASGKAEKFLIIY